MIRSISVCGAGTMGRCIAQVSASAGFQTILYEVNTDILNKAEQAIEKNFESMVEKKKISMEQKEHIFKRIQFTSVINDCISDVIIEAIVENLGLKTQLFNHLAEINDSYTIFATNTSSLSVTRIASQVKIPERLIGMHFFNPATVMPLVEVITTAYTNEITLRKVLELAKTMSKTSVLSRDSPGFIVNRVARPFYIESLRLLEEGKVILTSIDSIMESTGFKLGPFKLMDLIGNDINYAVSCSIYEQLGLPQRLKPSVIQKEKLDKGELGKKTGRGYYQYS